ncbi:YlcI/YnfO family protein [Moorena sp. SIO3H5]|uniref:type II toxin-antitoxin system TacA family antitoxin n=1 Tax=Moorena sp. SIO3H5 TaxID=2607834 RepID=UPI0025F3BA95|nr:YlcI/YnfO family protein [Moorena sp. SIO3H5]
MKEIEESIQMASTTPNDTRLIARLPASVKDTLQKAADLTGATLNQFMVQAQVKEAQKVINKN